MFCDAFDVSIWGYLASSDKYAQKESGIYGNIYRGGF
jgi:hypothetical protein